MAVVHLFAGVAVRDFAVARPWYERLFGRPPDMLPTDGEAVWRLAPEGSVYVTVDPDRAGCGLVTIAVSDLDEHLATLRAAGIAAGDPSTGHGEPRHVVVADDDGNSIKIFEAPP